MSKRKSSRCPGGPRGSKLWRNASQRRRQINEKKDRLFGVLATAPPGRPSADKQAERTQAVDEFLARRVQVRAAGRWWTR